MAISKVASHRLLCCVPTLYVHIPESCFSNVKCNHTERLIFVRLLVRLLNFTTS